MPSDHRSSLRSTYRTQARDTDVRIERLILEAYRRMPSWEKARRVGEMIETIEMLALAGIAARHPEASAQERRLRLAALRIDRDTMIRAFGWDPAIHGY